jgi:DNA-binding transcriptional regulator YdaS (Cro superfamily)
MELKTYLSPRGRVNELAALIGVPAALMSQWKVGARPVPAERCPAIEKATAGAVRCEDLRPDVDWAYLRATDCAVEKLGAGETAQPMKEAA